MAMEEPHAGVIGAEAEHRIATAGDQDCITEGGAGEIVGLEGGVIWVWGFRFGVGVCVWLETGWIGVCKGVVGAPTVGGLLDG